MGLILDTSIFILGERRGLVLDQVEAKFPDLDSAVSAISIVEIDHGIYRAQTEAQRRRRLTLSTDLSRDMTVHPITLEIAHLAGRIEGEQAARGIAIPLADLLIGCTAFHFRDSVLTLNPKHFDLIPSLSVLTL
jgi:tRNA(fMet)-specific endonuclease VapC